MPVDSQKSANDPCWCQCIYRSVFSYYWLCIKHAVTSLMNNDLLFYEVLLFYIVMLNKLENECTVWDFLLSTESAINLLKHNIISLFASFCHPNASFVLGCFFMLGAWVASLIFLLLVCPFVFVSFTFQSACKLSPLNLWLFLYLTIGFVFLLYLLRGNSRFVFKNSLLM